MFAAVTASRLAHPAADSDDDSDDEPVTARRPGRDPKTVFRSAAADGSSQYFSLWNAVLWEDTRGVKDVHASALIAALQDVALRHTKWALVMNRGGHFAAAVFDVRTKQRQGTTFAVLEHKTFHRFVSSLRPDPKKQ